MATTPFVPELSAPSQITEKYGALAADCQHKRRKLLHELKIRGLLKPSTLLNLGPFPLRVDHGHIPHAIPPCPKGKDFAVHTIDHARTYVIYASSRPQEDQSIKHIFDVKAILPVEQHMEYMRAYSMDSSQQGVSFGGIVVFEGRPDLITLPDVKVMQPYYDNQGRDRFLMFREVYLAEYIAEAGESLRTKCMAMIQEGNTLADGNEDQKRSLAGGDYYVWADFAVQKGYVNGAPKWRSTTYSAPEDNCDKCGERFVSKTGVCKCGYVRYPFVAFMKNEIPHNHVRMDSLTSDEWAQVKEEQERRKKARGN